MFKFIILGISIFFMLNSAVTAQDRFAKYPKIVGYEVRPGILMIPRYTAGNELCEIGLEKLLYSSSLIRLEPNFSRKEINDILDVLVPISERGAASKDTVGNLVTRGGASQITHLEFENVWIQIYGAVLSSGRKNEVTVNELVATVKWKNRICR